MQSFEAEHAAIWAEYYERVHPVYLKFCEEGQGGQFPFTRYEAFLEKIKPFLQEALAEVAKLKAEMHQFQASGARRRIKVEPHAERG